MKKKGIIYLILIVLWCSLIYLLSDMTSRESNKTSKKIVETSAVETAKATNKMKITNININDKTWRRNIVKKYNVILRKLAHGLVYFVLSILIYLFLINMRVNPKKAIYWTIALCFIYSTTDEIHQTFVMERTGQLLDCIIDTIGASLGSILTYYLNIKERTIKKAIT